VVQIVGEVEDRTADDGVHACVHPWQVVYVSNLKALVWRSRREGRGKTPCVRHCPRVAVDAVAREPTLQQEPQVATVAAAGVEYAGARVEATAQELIEEVDVDLAERLTQFGANRLGWHGRPAQRAIDFTARVTCATSRPCA
jgi:hypothetical protein